MTRRLKKPVVYSLYAIGISMLAFGIVLLETSSKKFRIEGSLSRNADTLNKFISKFVKSGNTIISDNWAGYDYLDREDSGYVHIKFNHGQGQFGYGLSSTSHIESLWEF